QLEQQQQGQALTDLYEGVLALKRRYGLHDVLVRPRDSLAVRRDGEREQVHELVKRYRDVPGDQQRHLPALLNSLGQLEVLVGERGSGEEVVVKALREDSLDRPSAVLFHELQWLQDLDHPALARIRDFGYADANQTRPYVVLDHFEATTLAEHVKRNGPLGS